MYNSWCSKHHSLVFHICWEEQVQTVTGQHNIFNQIKLVKKHKLFLNGSNLESMGLPGFP